MAETLAQLQQEFASYLTRQGVGAPDAVQGDANADPGERMGLEYSRALVSLE